MKLIKERGVSIAQAFHDPDVAESALRRWLRERDADLHQAIPMDG